MKKYLCLARNSFISSIAYRFHYFFSFFTNIFYIIIIYYLWKAIYSNTNNSLNGLTFNQTFIYLALASAIFVLFNTFTEWKMSGDIISGNICHDLIKPFDYQLRMLSTSLGLLFFTLLTITLPTIVIMILFFEFKIISIISLLLFLLSLLIAFLISFIFDFIIGTLSFYTESIWGISITKEILVLLLSGATIPIQFFPEILQKMIVFLPFQAIYNIPLSILIVKDSALFNSLQNIFIQIVWLLILIISSRLFYKLAIRRITISGG